MFPPNTTTCPVDLRELEPEPDSVLEADATAPIDLDAIGTLDEHLDGVIAHHGETESGPSSVGLPPPDLEPFALEQQKRALMAEMFDLEQSPAQLERYEIRGELGRGGMGVVYAAYDARLERKVAIKQLLTGQSSASMRRRFISEAQAMAKLSHPNVAMIHEISEGGAFIVMEYIEGLTLQRWLEGPRSLGERIAALCQAGRGLAAAHAKGLVHRDFKPANVMVGDDGRVRVMDFGLAASDPQHVQTGPPGERAELSTRTDLTRSGALIGTPAYMAPEQLRGAWADARSDQFAFCVTLYLAVYGQRPFSAPNMALLLRAIESGELPPQPPELEVPMWLRELLRRGLQPEPCARFASMDALLAALERRSGSSAPPRQVIVVHDPADKVAVTRVCAGLLDHGVRCWLDLWELAPNERGVARTCERLHEAPAVLICEGPRGWRGGELAGLSAPLQAALRARIAADPQTVHRLRLPGAPPSASSSAPPPLLRDAPLELAEGSEERSLLELAERIGVDHERSRWLVEEAEATGLVPEELCPYRGLEAFSERDARWMFGREQEIEQLLGRLRDGSTRFLTLAGASGSGKSSLALAGLCPALRRGALPGPGWRIASLRPGARPCEALALALVELSPYAGDDPLADALRATQLREQLMSSPETAGRFLRLLAETTADEARLLLVVDQLEEVFTEGHLGHAELGREAEAFVDNLLEVCATQGQVWVLTTLRADFIPRSLEVPALARALQRGTYFALPPMSEAQLRAAIVRPLRRVGYELEPRLVEMLVRAAAGRVGQLPLLQHLLRELWQRRDPKRRVLPYSSYAETGGLEGAIAVAAERALGRAERELGESARRIVRRLMTRLVHLGDGEAGHTRRRVCARALGAEDPATRLVLETFVHQARVLVATEQDGEEIIEIAHEALLREWLTLVAWLAADREALRVRQELARDAAKWSVQRHWHRRREYLWGPSRVAESMRVLGNSSVELDELEDTFLAASREQLRRNRTRLAGYLAGLFAAILVSIAFTYANMQIDIRAANTRKEEAEAVSKEATAGRNKAVTERNQVKAELEQAKAELEQAEAKLARARNKSEKPP